MCQLINNFQEQRVLKIFWPFGKGRNILLGLSIKCSYQIRFDLGVYQKMIESQPLFQAVIINS